MRTFFKLHLLLCGGLTAICVLAEGTLVASDLIGSLVGATILAPPLLLPLALWRLVFRKTPRNGLDTVLFRFSSGDKFTLAHLLTGLAIFGQIGSGKSSGSGLAMARAAVGIPNSSGIIFSSNPDDVTWWTRRFGEAGRPGDLKIFSPTSDCRRNILQEEMEAGADSRDLTKLLVTVGESISDSKGGSNEMFWRLLQERIIYFAVETLRQAYGRWDAPMLSRFIASAPYNPAQLIDPEWREGFFSRTLELAFNKPGKSGIEKADFQMLKEFWINEFVSMDDKPRSSALAGVNNIFHNLNTGIAREIISTTTNTPVTELADGTWHLWDFPVSKGGASSKFLYAAAKYSTERWILRRDFSPGDSPVVIWADEAWHIINSGDTEFLSECRKHGGTLIFLTQSVSNYYIALGGGNDHHKADALLGQFACKIFHACDPVTADYASKLIGNSMQVTVNSSPRDREGKLDQFLGGEWNASFNQAVRPLVEPRELMTGLRTSGGVVDGWVHRTGVGFAGGYGNAIRVTFKQE